MEWGVSNMAAGAMVKTVLKGANFGDAMNVIGGVTDYKHARSEGNSKTVSLAKAVGTFAFYEALGAYAIPFTLVQAGTSIASAVWQNNAQQMSKAYASNGKLGSGHFNMTEAGYTMRQRSLNAIRSNGMNLQSALGNEARQYVR